MGNVQSKALMMRCLELFAGTQSFSKAARRAGHTSVTVDLLPKFKPNIVTDILTWNYKIYPVGWFDVIWASPPCTEYSKAKTRGVRNLDHADKLVRKSLEIIDYFKPKYWLIENVGTGLLVDRMESIRPFMPRTFCDYCPYGTDYRKRTVFWTNLPLKLKVCAGSGKCPGMDGEKHRKSIGNGTPQYNGGQNMTVWEKDAIPEALVDYIVGVAFSSHLHHIQNLSTNTHN
jgi:hypothetical protein